MNNFINKKKLTDPKRNNCYIVNFENHSEIRWDLDSNLNQEFIDFLVIKLNYLNINGIGNFNTIQEISEEDKAIKSLFFENYNYNLTHIIDKYKNINKEFSLEQFKNIFNKILTIGVKLENNFEFYEELSPNHVYINKKVDNNSISEFELLISNSYSFNSYHKFINNIFNLNLPENITNSKNKILEYYENNKDNIKLKNLIDFHRDNIKKNVKSFSLIMMLIVLLNKNLNFNNFEELKKYLKLFYNKNSNIDSKEYFIISKLLENYFGNFIPSFNYINDYYNSGKDELNFFNNQILSESIEVEKNMINLDFNNIEVIKKDKGYSNLQLNFGKNKQEVPKVIHNLNLKHNLKDLNSPYPNNPPVFENSLDVSFNMISNNKFNKNRNIQIKKSKAEINEEIPKNFKKYINHSLNNLEKKEFVFYDPYSLNNRKNDENREISNNNPFPFTNPTHKPKYTNDFTKTKQDIKDIEHNKQDNLEKIYKNIINQKDDTNQVLLDMLITNLEQMNNKIKNKRIYRENLPKKNYTDNLKMDYESFKQKFYPENNINFNEFPYNQIPNYNPHIYNNQNPNHFKYFESLYEKSKKLNLNENWSYHDQKAYLNIINKLLINKTQQIDSNVDLDLSDSNLLDNINFV